MPFTLTPFKDTGLDEPLLDLLLDRHASHTLPACERLWSYYRNPLRPRLGSESRRASQAWYRQAQEAGLPARITGRAAPNADDRAADRREVVIENDIAWRLHTMVDFMFGKPVTLVSTAPDESLRRTIERTLDEIWERSGGIALLQDMALLGHVYGHVDLLLRLDPESDADGPDSFARRLRIEVVDPSRGIALTDPADYRRITAYVLSFERELGVSHDRPGFLRSLLSGQSVAKRRRSGVVEIFSPDARQLYHDRALVDQEPLDWTGGQTPVVHIQNLSQPFRYEGLSDVEPLIPLQDELNTRLSDRASRVTLQSFKMYLAKGIDGFDRAPVGPGQIWSTDNTEASVEAFGGDGASPSEEAHIGEIREALDKVSGVPPLAGGVVRAKIGNLSSANALRITLMALLGKTARKRVTYGRGIAQMSSLILTALNHAGALATSPRDRAVRIQWPEVLPEDTRESVASAEAKLRIGVPRERVLSELGYAPTDPGLT